MQRQAIGFYLDQEGDWTAKLDCYHAQHVRHIPPLSERAWVLTPEGRDAHIGMALNCVRCDALEFPEGLTAYKETPEFTELSIPKGLLKDHSTKAGVWGQIQVSSGSLNYSLSSSGLAQLIGAGETGYIPPEVKHRVAAEGKVTFKVVFFKPGS